MKADFIPQLEDDEDTSYFDNRLERYNHEDLTAVAANDTRSSAEDTDDTQMSFASFTSASPRYRYGPRKSDCFQERNKDFIQKNRFIY